MGTKRSLIEIVHDEGYGDSLLTHVNIAFGSRDMRAERIVPTNDNFRTELLGALIESSNYDELYCRAMQLVENPSL